jgi:hypothetical protein
LRHPRNDPNSYFFKMLNRLRLTDKFSDGVIQMLLLTRNGVLKRAIIIKLDNSSSWYNDRMNAVSVYLGIPALSKNNMPGQKTLAARF